MADAVLATADNVLLQFGNTGSSPRSVKFQYGSGGTLKFQVNDHGDVTITGEFVKNGAFIFNNASGTGDLMKVASSGSDKIVFGNNGHGDFAQGGLRTAVTTSDPDDSRAGAPGDMVLWDDSSGTTNYYWCVCTASPNTWRHAVLST